MENIITLNEYFEKNSKKNYEDKFKKWILKESLFSKRLAQFKSKQEKNINLTNHELFELRGIKNLFNNINSLTTTVINSIYQNFKNEVISHICSNYNISIEQFKSINELQNKFKLYTSQNFTYCLPNLFHYLNICSIIFKQECSEEIQSLTLNTIKEKLATQLTSTIKITELIERLHKKNNNIIFSLTEQEKDDCKYRTPVDMLSYLLVTLDKHIKNNQGSIKGKPYIKKLFEYIENAKLGYEQVIISEFDRSIYSKFYIDGKFTLETTSDTLLKLVELYQTSIESIFVIKNNNRNLIIDDNDPNLLNRGYFLQLKGRSTSLNDFSFNEISESDKNGLTDVQIKKLNQIGRRMITSYVKESSSIFNNNNRVIACKLGNSLVGTSISPPDISKILKK